MSGKVNVQVPPSVTYDNPVFWREDVEEENFYDKVSGGPVTNIIAEDSVLEIGNKIEFNGGVIILPEGSKHATQSAEKIFDGLQTGEVSAKKFEDELKEKLRRERRCRTKLSIFLGVVAIIATIIIVVTVIPSKETECSDYVSRSKWKADQPRCELPKYEKTPILVLVYQTEKRLCETCPECTKQVQGLQAYQQKPRSIRATVRPAPACDIQYNVLVGGDGRIYEGRGVSVQGEMPDSFQNQTFILAFMGLFVVYHPKEKQLTAAKEFLEGMAKKGYLDPNFKIAGAMQVRRSDSPGCALLNDLRVWERWTDEPLKLLNSSRHRNETNAGLCYESPPTVDSGSGTAK